MLAESADLIIPTSKASRDAIDPEAVFVVSIDKNKNIDLDGESLSLTELPSKLAALRNENAELAVIIRSDRDIPVQFVVDIMDTLKTVEITNVGIVTKPDG